MIEIIPSILTSDPQAALEMLSKCEGIADRVSVDIIDGKFADNKTIEPDLFQDAETTAKLDFQLMVTEPINWIEKCIRGQAERIIGHVEFMSDQVAFVGKVQEAGLKVGLALDLETPVTKIDPVIINSLDVILLMSVHAGFGGQKFDDRVLEKIEKLDQLRLKDETPFKIHDDGGITFDKIDDLRASYVDEVSIGVRIFEGDLKENIDKFRKAAYNIKATR